MKDILKETWMIEMIRTLTNMYGHGWDERNGGNVSMLLDGEQVADCLDIGKVIRTLPTGFPVPELAEKPEWTAGYFRCAWRSLADTYGRAVRTMEQSTGTVCRKLYIVGGGAKNRFLNRLTEEATVKQVIAIPMEATAVGNIRVQIAAEAAGKERMHER